MALWTGIREWRGRLQLQKTGDNSVTGVCYHIAIPIRTTTFRRRTVCGREGRMGSRKGIWRCCISVTLLLWLHWASGSFVRPPRSLEDRIPIGTLQSVLSSSSSTINYGRPGPALAMQICRVIVYWYVQDSRLRLFVDLPNSYWPSAAKTEVKSS